VRHVCVATTSSSMKLKSYSHSWRAAINYCKILLRSTHSTHQLPRSPLLAMYSRCPLLQILLSSTYM